MNLDKLSGTVPANAEQMLGADDTRRSFGRAHLQKGSGRTWEVASRAEFATDRHSE